jgi:hypothetical protein
LAREQLELIRNIRDNNYKKVQIYNQINPEWDWSIPWYYNNVDNFFQIWNYYKMSNDFSDIVTNPIKVEKINNFWEWKSELSWKMQSYKLCLDSNNLYTYDCTWLNTPTVFYKYIKIDVVKDKTWVINDSFKVTSKVVWYKRWYHETEISTILADWKRL